MEPPIYRVVCTHPTYNPFVVKMYATLGSAKRQRTRLQNNLGRGSAYTYIIESSNPLWKQVEL